MTAPVDCATEAEFLDEMETSIRERRLCRLASVNASIAVMAHDDRRFRESLWRFEMVNPDGKWVAVAGRHLLGHPIPEQVGTPPLVAKLLARAVREGYRVYFLGASREVVAQAVGRSQERWRGMQMAGYEDGYTPSAMWPEAADRVAASDADVLLLGLPSPMKEYWALEYGGRANVPVIIGVGGLLDILSGNVRPAPEWVRTIGMEWSYRMMQEPRRLGPRYLRTTPRFIAGVTRQAWRRAASSVYTRVRRWP